MTKRNGLQLFDLTGNVALVTGGGRGIGRALAKGLAQFGCDVAVVDIDPKGQKSVVNDIRKQGKRCLFLAADITDPKIIQGAVEEILAKFRRIDILVNNAGVDIRKPALEVTEKEWDLIVDTNMKGSFFTSQAVAKSMAKRRQGKIINIASVMGLVGSPSFQCVVPYCGSKGGVVQLTKSLALEWAKYNVHVNAIAPGPIKTRLMQALMKDRKRSQAVLNMVPLQRFAAPEELVGPTVFLASHASDYMTGHILFVEGGWLAQ